MNSIFSFVFFVGAFLVASVHCSAYGGGSASVLNAQSYSLGANHGDYGDQSPAYIYSPSSTSYSHSSKPRFIIQPLVTQEIYPGRNQYKTYHSAPYYSQIALPIVTSAPLARLYSSQSSSYGSSAGGYDASSY